jgi:LEA14-like dessication related protein
MHYFKKSYVEYRKEVSQFLEEVETEIENNEQSEVSWKTKIKVHKLSKFKIIFLDSS